MDVVGLLILLGVGYVAFEGVLTIHVYAMLTRPKRASYAYAVARGIAGDPSELPGAHPFDEWSIRDHQGRELPVWDIKGDVDDGATLIVTHGWSGSRVAMLRRLPHLLTMAQRVVIWDLPGHGEAPGSSTLGARDAETLRSLIERVRTDDNTLILCGYSLGAGVSLDAADADGVDGLILEASYAAPLTPATGSVRAAGLPAVLAPRLASGMLGLVNGFATSWFTDGGRFNRARIAAHRDVPMLILHGEDDDVCPVDEAEAIDTAAPRSELVIIEGASHADFWLESTRERVQAHYGRFIDEILNRAGAPAGR